MAAAVKMKEREFSVPSLSEASPQYAELAGRKTALLAQKVATEADISRIKKEMGKPRPLPYSAKVAELIGEPVTEASEPLANQRRELEKHLHAINQAIAVVESRLSIERGKASLIICDQVRDEHRRLARDVCFKLIDLRQAMLAYSEFADALNDGDIAWSSLSPSQLLALGHPLDPQSRTALHLRSMVANGFLDKDEVPKQIQ